jgi:hypothetical protein
MVVVAGGAKLIGKNIQIEIERLIQTDAGKMLFASHKDAQTPNNQPRRNNQKRNHPKS